MADTIKQDGRPEALRIENLSIGFGGLKALDDLSFMVYEKEIFGLIGPNGAGKTTVFNCITQFYKPDSGNVFFRVENARLPKKEKKTDSGGDGADGMVNLVGRPVHSIIKLGLVRTFQNVEIIPELSLIDNVLIGAHVDFKSNMFDQAFRLPRARREEKIYHEKALEAMRFLGIDDKKDELAGGQPYGVLKKIEMTRTLMSNPRLIILDEPAAGLNDVETEELAEIIRRIREQYQCTILLVEHDMRLVMNICDRICAISFGKFLAMGSPEEIQKNTLVQEAYLGEKEDE
ncbi:MAG: ABC transporter ATP-binding protein [Clostridiales Family XIII bacterium]|jgi:branched-chain amino acid transport system ATP-binding protein|nr:ABC transporter ATP-binding protein [Clostridiales Family XIII bacterium]